MASIFSPPISHEGLGNLVICAWPFVSAPEPFIVCVQNAQKATTTTRVPSAAVYQPLAVPSGYIIQQSHNFDCLMMASSNGSSSKLKGRNIKNLTLPSPKLASKPASSAADAQVPGSRASHNLSSRRVSNSHNVDETIRPDSVVGDLTEQMATLELGVEFKLDLRPEDLKTVERLGAGNGGTVSKVMHIPTKTIMAKKVTFLSKTDED